ncbi:MAG: hypothetical protein AAGB46_18920 [Verrucomicrobiota bacterium]
MANTRIVPHPSKSIHSCIIMGLTRKSTRLLELLMLSGLDIIEVAFNTNSLLYSYSGWSSDRNAARNLKSLSNKGLMNLENTNSKANWVAKLTESGKRQLFGKILPEDEWNHVWDGKWRLLSFDLPRDASVERKQLRKWLQARRFGQLQGSLWVTHRPYDNWTNEIQGEQTDPKKVILLESKTIGEIDNQGLISRTWKFDIINERYEAYLNFVKNTSPQSGPSSVRWFEEESVLWNSAYEIDPFLPYSLQPRKYKGRQAWHARKEVFKKWAHTLLSPQS